MKSEKMLHVKRKNIAIKFLFLHLQSIVRMYSENNVVLFVRYIIFLCEMIVNILNEFIITSVHL